MKWEHNLFASLQCNEATTQKICYKTVQFLFSNILLQRSALDANHSFITALVYFCDFSSDTSLYPCVFKLLSWASEVAQWPLIKLKKQEKSHYDGIFVSKSANWYWNIIDILLIVTMYSVVKIFVLVMSSMLQSDKATAPKQVEDPGREEEDFWCSHCMLTGSRSPSLDTEALSINWPWFQCTFLNKQVNNKTKPPICSLPFTLMKM